MNTILSVRNLHVTLGTGASARPLVRGVDLELRGGETLTLIGESGSGKTLTSLALLRLLPPGMRATADALMLAGSDLRALDETRFNDLRGRRMAMVFQDPVGAFNPAKRIGWHMRAVLTRAGGRGKWRERAEAALADVQIAQPAAALGRYPHQLSGGMLQRVLIAMVLALGPDIVIADEPTTNLDNIVERQVLALFDLLQARLGSALLFVTHDMTIAALVSDRIAVMYAGEIVETGPAAAILAGPLHPYTRALIHASRALEDAGRDAALPEIAGQPPSPAATITGCAFRPRCATARAGCDLPQPARERGPGHFVRCLLHE